MNQAGLVLVAVAGLWIAYLVPHRSRYRQDLLESRADDRFSEHLRVLRVSRDGDRSTAGGRVPGAPGPHRTTGVRLHPERRGGGGTMDRPHGTTDRVVADAARRAAAERAQRVAHLARRRAAARRRALLTAVLLVAVVAGWTTVAAVAAPVLAGAIPSVALLGVLGLGRAAVRAGERADAAWAAGAAERQALPAATAGARTVGRAVRPSEARTEVLARVPRQRTTAADAERAQAAGATTALPTQRGERPAVASSTSLPSAAVGAGPTTSAQDERTEPAPAPQRTSAWSPVPVPPPSYTLKPSAPRREPAPLPAEDELATPAARAGVDVRTDPSVADGTAAGVSATPPAERAAQAPASLDLDAILARRRASGE
nr:hypothetical protein [uncultured Actinotalea sp.]